MTRSVAFPLCNSVSPPIKLGDKAAWFPWSSISDNPLGQLQNLVLRTLFSSEMCDICWMLALTAPPRRANSEGHVRNRDLWQLRSQQVGCWMCNRACSGIGTSCGPSFFFPIKLRKMTILSGSRWGTDYFERDHSEFSRVIQEGKDLLSLG